VGRDQRLAQGWFRTYIAPVRKIAILYCFMICSSSSSTSITRLFETAQGIVSRASRHPVQHSNPSPFLFILYSSSKGVSCIITLNPLALDTPRFPSDTMQWFPPFHATFYFSLKSQVARSTSSWSYAQLSYHVTFYPTSCHPIRHNNK
jgi:hypothetical protein